jgi:hypothetical protein
MNFPVHPAVDVSANKQTKTPQAKSIFRSCCSPKSPKKFTCDPHVMFFILFTKTLLDLIQNRFHSAHTRISFIKDEILLDYA